VALGLLTLRLLSLLLTLSNEMLVTGLKDLPVELLYTIHLLALSPSFPLVSSHLYNTFKNSSYTFKAQYLISKIIRDHFNSEPWDPLGCYRNRHPVGYLTIALRYSLCDRQVFDAVIKEMERINESGSELSGMPERSEEEEVERRRRLESDRERWKRYHPTIELPRRLFRNLTAPASSAPLQSSTSSYLKLIPPWTDRSQPLPFLRHIISKQTSLTPQETLRLNVDSYEGYALVRAVHARFVPLVQFLLDQGASPMMRDGLAVLVAIRSKDLHMTRILIERTEQAASGIAGGSTSSTGRGKKRKLEDRVTISSEMLKAAIQCDARDIVDYLMNEKGCVPDMSMLKLLSGGAKKARK
jgi:hypothetical protein